MNLRKSIRQSLIEMPQRLRIVPSVIKQKRVHLHAALLHQLIAERMHTIQRRRLIKAVAIPNVVPRVVMQKSPVRMRPLLLDIRKKIPPHLPWSRHPNHRRISNRIPCLQRQHARQNRRCSPIFHRTLRQRKLKPEKEISRHHRRTRNLPHNLCTWRVEVKHPHLGNINRLRPGLQRHLLSQIIRTLAQHRAPAHGHRNIVRTQIRAHPSPRHPRGLARRRRSRRSLLFHRSRLHLHLRSRNHTPIAQLQTERLPRQQLRPALPVNNLVNLQPNMHDLESRREPLAPQLETVLAPCCDCRNSQARNQQKCKIKYLRHRTLSCLNLHIGRTPLCHRRLT